MYIRTCTCTCPLPVTPAEARNVSCTLGELHLGLCNAWLFAAKRVVVYHAHVPVTCTCVQTFLKCCSTFSIHSCFICSNCWAVRTCVHRWAHKCQCAPSIYPSKCSQCTCSLALFSDSTLYACTERQHILRAEPNKCNSSIACVWSKQDLLVLTWVWRCSHSVIFWFLSCCSVAIISRDLVCSCSYCSDKVAYSCCRIL